MNFLENYYNNYDEEGRLLRRHGQVEYLTTMHYINDILKGDLKKRILEVGAGTGRYSVTLAKEGYEVDALELVEHNLEILKSKLDGTEKICPVQGNALDLSRYEDECFDLVLLLGPMYHLYTKEDRQKALEEAIRVTKKGGHICVAYCMNECVVVQFAFASDNIKDLVRKNMLTEDFHCLSNPEDLFAMVRLEEIYELTEELVEVEREKIVAADGATVYMRDKVNEFDDETFDLWMKYHLATCERMDLIGATNHSLDILRKRKMCTV